MMDLNGPAVIVGNPHSLFPRTLASCWRSRGLEVIIVTRQAWDGDSLLEDGTRVLSSESRETDEFHNHLNSVLPVLTELETDIRSLNPEQVAAALSHWQGDDGRPTVGAPFINGLAISQFVKTLRPRFVFGMEAYAYGFATALCHGIPRILMPWGSDIYNFAETDPLAFAMMKYVLGQVDFIVPSSVIAARHVCRRFGIPKEKTRPVSWGVDTERFVHADPERRRRICARFGIPPSAHIVTNLRRFRPAWGSETALHAMLAVAECEAECHFVFFGGSEDDTHLNNARIHFRQKGLEQRALFLRGNTPLADFADLISISDVSLSLMPIPDMRSFSILQAAASSNALVLTDQPEYREMEALGLRAQFVAPSAVDQVTTSTLKLLRDTQLREEISKANREFAVVHENHERQMTKLLTTINGVVAPYAERQTGHPDAVGKPCL
jgi:glycosyltransferase involved in cell wall biosynthesis